MCEIVSKSIAVLHRRVPAGDPSGPSAFPVMPLILLTELFQQLNPSMSVIPILSLESLAEVIIFNVLPVNVEFKGVCPFHHEVNFLPLFCFLKNLYLRVRLYFRISFVCTRTHL